MSLHSLLRAEARSLSLVQILALSDDDAFVLFRRQRWGDGEDVVCPHCGMVHRHYFRPVRKIWRWAGCREDFSVTSGTIFAFHKLPLRLYLAALILFVNTVKGIFALQLDRDLDFSRFRRFQIGQIHKVAPKYVDNDANEIAYREDARRWSNGEIFRDIVRKCAHALVGRDWCGYWQGNHRQGESLAI